MGLTDKREKILKKMPHIESKYEKSKDGKYIIHRTIITTIRPVSYFEKVLENEGAEEISENLKDGVEIVQGAEIEA